MTLIDLKQQRYSYILLLPLRSDHQRNKVISLSPLLKKTFIPGMSLVHIHLESNNVYVISVADSVDVHLRISGIKVLEQLRHSFPREI